MSYPAYYNAQNTLSLFGLKKNFDFLKLLYEKKRLPKVTLLSGDKGVGKSTLVNHFLYSVFDKKNYNIDLRKINHSSSFL